MSTPKVCKRCQTYLLDHQDYLLRHKGWKYCHSCGWACDREGYNLVDKKPEPEKVEKEEDETS